MNESGKVSLVSLMIKVYIGKEIHTRRNNILLHVCHGHLTSVHKLPSVEERSPMCNFLGVYHDLSPPHNSSSDSETIHLSKQSHVVRLALHLNSTRGVYTSLTAAVFHRTQILSQNKYLRLNQKQSI
jgi:hypothetical protein